MSIFPFLKSCKKFVRFSFIFVFLAASGSTSFLFAQSKAQAKTAEKSDKENLPVEINGDKVEFLVNEDRVVAEGNVSVIRQGMTLTCDKIDFSRATKIGTAEGHVVLVRDKERITGDHMVFNFDTMQGEFFDAKVYAAPMYGAGQKISKVGENHLVMERGYLTTCDHDVPHFRFFAPKADIYPKDKAVARNARLILGKVPVMYVPKYSQDLRENQPAVIFTPGYKKDWGAFLLSRWRYHLTDDVKGTFNWDYRFRKGFAVGANLDYTTKNFGKGIFRTYFPQEHATDKKFFFSEQSEPATIRERYKAEWRHFWEIDQQTNLITQYYKLSDQDFLKDYFEREYDKDSNPSTYFILTRGLPEGILSLRAEPRVNRFVAAVERLPELDYDLSNYQFGETNFYLKNTSSIAELSKKNAYPDKDHRKTLRLDTDNEVSYPFKVRFIELRPFVGGRETFYSRTVNQEDYNSMRGIFRTGSDVSTKFYRLFDVHTNAWGLNINRLRHVVTPSVAYLYQHDPTMASTQLDQFDEVDAQTQLHTINFGIENKLQTKRNGSRVDLVRFIVGTDFHLKEDVNKGGFHDVTSDLEVKPYDWLSFLMDSSYDTIDRRMNSINFDCYINRDSDKWYVRLGERYAWDVEKQLTSEFGYRINQKWRFKTYHQYYLDTGKMKAQEYGLRRDLHEWWMDINFNQTRGQGNEIWVVFTLKAFPDNPFDFGVGFNRQKAGSSAATQ